MEVCWLSLPIVGMLSQIGGTWWKAARRYGIPLIAVGMMWMFTGFDLRLIPMGLHMFAAFCMPVTKFGDSIPGDWRNWVWIQVWGALLCTPVIWLSMQYLVPALVCGALLTTMVALSNIKCTAKWFQWKFVELFEGILPLVPLCYLITLK